MERIFLHIANEIKVQPQQVKVAVELLDGGATVPFIARYRKEATGLLNDTQLRQLEEKLYYLREMEDRRTTIINSIRKQEKLTPQLEKAILDAITKTELEDLYLPYKPKRKTKGMHAIECGLAPLADDLLHNRQLCPEEEAKKYLNENINSIGDALDGAKYILMDRFSESVILLGQMRNFLWENYWLSSQVITEKKTEAVKFTDYFDHKEAVKKMPSHRVLAILRGKKTGLLKIAFFLPSHNDIQHPCETMIAKEWGCENCAKDSWLTEVVNWTWQFKLKAIMNTEITSIMKQNAEKKAIETFSVNLKDILMSSRAGQQVTMGLDPGLRTGVKIAIVDKTSNLLDHATIYPHAPQNRLQEAKGLVIKLILKYQIKLIAIGNGTASRETEHFIDEIIKQYPNLQFKKVIVNEAGASVYSASEQAAKEFPDLDVVFRGAVSIARRLQDPLAELVKIDPKAIGVGQYQHDVNQSQLARSLEATVEDCVNAVGVDVNTASVDLLRRVSGLNVTLANNIVQKRKSGAFTSRKQLLDVERMGNKSYEQAVGFLRVINGDNPLDSSAVHPETYPIVEQMAQEYHYDIKDMIGNAEYIDNINPEHFINDKFGLPTIMDIIAELKKPGKDPRPAFKTVVFRSDIQSIKDLQADMVLEGVISNITKFGAFVDIGIHQNGLIHISSLCNRFIKDPREVVKIGEIVKVKVLKVDIERNRIALTMREIQRSLKKPVKPKKSKPVTIEKQGTFAELFAQAKPIKK